MKLIDTIAVPYQEHLRNVQLFVGDLTRLPKSEAVDVLVVSAFPDDYSPTTTSLIGALDAAGVSVGDLALHKEVDLRQFSSCWLSRPIEKKDVNFRRVLCFEPYYRGKAPEVVGDIFRSIFPFTAGNAPIAKIAMPLVAAGDQRESPAVMLEALADAAVNWLKAGLPLDCIKIVIREQSDSSVLRETFSRVKARHAQRTPSSDEHSFQYDIFISYSHKNVDLIDDFASELRVRRPQLRIFLDKLELQAGAAWQQNIFESLDASQKVICALSPDYLGSKVCKEEFNIALLRHRDSAAGVLLPLYLYTADLPTYMKLIQFEDIREGDRQRMGLSAEKLLRQL